MLNWTEEQLLGLALDSFTIQAARGLAKPEKWHSLGRVQDGAWCILTHAKNKEPIQTMLLFQDMTLWCTCRATKAPCNHGLTLMLMLVNQTDAFETAVSPPTWFLAKQKRYQQQKQASPHNQTNKLLLLQSGMSELELWLKDMIRNGLADLPDRPPKYWSDMANRMVDAEAPIISHTLHALSKVPVKQKDWPELYLRQLGQLYLLVQGFKQWETLSPQTQADLKTAVGWLPTQPGNLEIDDDWLVVGRTQEVYGRHRRLLTWLWGITGRPAALVQKINPGKATSNHYTTGTYLKGTIRFAEGNWPLFGILPSPLIVKENQTDYGWGYASISDAINGYTQSKIVFPWLTYFPMLLKSVKPMRNNHEWLLVDEEGTVLPVVTPLSFGWHLQALSNGRSLTLFGTWDGTAFDPISVKTDQGCRDCPGWLDLRVLRGVR